jgi:hypothetical protein
MVSTGQRTRTAGLRINPLIKLESTSGVVGSTVNAQLRGFGGGESVLVSFDTGDGVRSLVRATTSSTGSADVSFVVPASSRGKHRVSAAGSLGNGTYTSYFIRQSAFISAGTPEAGRLVRVQVRGFVGGEVAEARFDAPEATALGSVTVSATGSGSVAVRIPADASEGPHDLWLIGSQGTAVRLPLTVATAAIPTPTATATSTVEPSATISDETPTVESSTETPVPTETATTEIPTETATAVVPTETPTPAPEGSAVDSGDT